MMARIGLQSTSQLFIAISGFSQKIKAISIISFQSFY
jgi:hypothetical protein